MTTKILVQRVSAAQLHRVAMLLSVIAVSATLLSCRAVEHRIQCRTPECLSEGGLQEGPFSRLYATRDELRVALTAAMQAQVDAKAALEAARAAQSTANQSLSAAQAAQAGAPDFGGYSEEAIQSLQAQIRDLKLQVASVQNRPEGILAENAQQLSALLSQAKLQMQIDSLVKTLRDGKLAFTTPPAVARGESFKQRAMLSLDMTDGQLRQQLGENGDVVIEATKVGSFMEATLVGSSGLAITSSANDATQIVPSSGAVTWDWSVEGVKEGKQTLTLYLSLVLPEFEGSPRRSVSQVVRTIDVTVTAKQRWADRARDNWEFVLGTLLVPFGVWLYKTRKKPEGGIAT